MNEEKWDRLLQIRTGGRDDSSADQYRYPYEPTPYPVLERLANAGVKGIWNFTNYEISIPQENVVVESVHFSDSLLALSYMISQREDRRDREEQGGENQ